MTMHIDEKLLGEVMEYLGTKNKTLAVDMSLKEMKRRAKLKEFAEKGLGFTSEELKNAVDENYDVDAMRAAEVSGKYGKSRPRR